MDKPENYYAILGVPIDADHETIKRAYRQLARRYHPDIAGNTDAVEMKRLNRAYSVLNDPEKRLNYDTIIAGTIDLRGFARPRQRPHTFNPAEDSEFEGLRVFSTRGPLHPGLMLHHTQGIVSALNGSPNGAGLLIAAGSLDGKGTLWQIHQDQAKVLTHIVTDPALTIESLRELRFSEAGTLLAGWGRLHLHIWDTYSGERLWSQSVLQRAVSAHYSLDIRLHVDATQRSARIALPLQPTESHAPGAWGVRGSDILDYDLTNKTVSPSLACPEEDVNNRRFWAIRMRALSRDGSALVTLSCAQVDDRQMLVVRRWDLTTRARFGKEISPQINSSILVGLCDQCQPPYVITPDASTIAFVSGGNKILLCDTLSGSYIEITSGAMGGSARLAISADGQWLAIAREDSEMNEGVVDLWSITTNQLLQKFYHPWQVSALHFAGKQLLVALTDGTIQIWG
jgi:WD40 repeat protein